MINNALKQYGWNNEYNPPKIFIKQEQDFLFFCYLYFRKLNSAERWASRIINAS